MAWSVLNNVDQLVEAAAQRRSGIAAALRRHPSSGPHAGTTTAVVIRDAAELIEPEIARARRYDRNLGVICIPAQSAETIEVVRATVRSTDTTAPVEDGVLVVVPETDPHGVDICTKRLASALSIDVRTIGAVHFPHDALTIGSVVQLLSERTSAGGSASLPSGTSTSAA